MNRALLLVTVLMSAACADATARERAPRTLAQTEWRFGDSAAGVEALGSLGLYARRRNLAARFTHVDGDNRDVQWIAEWSTARPTPAMLPGSAFRWALGADRGLGDGLRLEMRLGERRRDDAVGGGYEAAAMLSLRVPLR